MPSTNFAYVNGNIVPETEARVSIFDRGFLHGDGAFETMRAYAGAIFLLDQHLARLTESLAALQIPAPPPSRIHIRELLGRNAIRDGVVRLTVTRGCGQPTVVITAQPRTFAPRALRAIISSIRVHRQLARHKTASRLPYTLARLEAERAGADEALLLNETGQIAEFSASNIFVVKDAMLYTPSLDDGTLPGVTRSVVLDLAQNLGIPTHQTTLPKELLDTAAEVFATNSLIEIAPVVTWSRANDITARLQAAYRTMVATTTSFPISECAVDDIGGCA
ncbi:MAG: branched-chain amino acid aminotransferase [Verrucomicrobia bacterium]|nr:branched-chain amino acid aminotransferase [Verrucomicrobiota bacterium]